MKYCTNCKANKESWAEKLKDYNKYSDDRCWECDKYALENLKIVEIKGGVEERISCNMRGGCIQETVYHNADGTSTRTYIKTGNWKALEMNIQVPPKRSPSPDCKIL